MIKLNIKRSAFICVIDVIGCLMPIQDVSYFLG